MGIGRSISTLRHVEAQVAARGRSVSISKLVGTVHGEFELVTGTPPPGAGSRLLRPHDHCEIGVPLPRNAQHTFDCGQRVGSGQGLRWQNQTAVDWFRPYKGSFDYSYITATNERFATKPANFHIYVTPNIDSDNTAVSTNPCYLSVFGLVGINIACSLRFYNRTLDQVSATISLTNTTSIDEFSGTCPCRGGVVNEIDVEMFCSTTSNLIVMHQLTFAETRTTSQPASSGTALYASSTRP